MRFDKEVDKEVKKLKYADKGVVGYKFIYKFALLLYTRVRGD